MPVRSRLIAVIFAILLLLPTLDQVTGLSAEFSSTENRRLKRMPDLHFPHVRSFVQQFDRYYKENFGWRNALFYAYSRWKYNVLEQSPLPEKVVVGKNGWFYLGNSYNKVIDQHRGLLPLSADSAKLIANHVAFRQQELAKQGIKLYVFIAPDSHTIYPENLPDHLQISKVSSRLDVLAQAMRQTSIPFIDVRDTLITAKHDHIVYYKTDTHWNDYGTLVGCAALLNRIRQDWPVMIPIRASDYTIVQQHGIGGDLTSMLTLQNEEKDSIFYMITPANKLASRQTASIKLENLDFLSTRFVGSGSGSLLLIGDSFSHPMMQYLPAYFHNSYFIRAPKLTPEIIEAEHPTILVFEVVERNIEKLATF